MHTHTLHSEEPKASSKSQSVSRIIKVDRQLNVVVYGVPENTTGTSRLSRQQNDLSKAIEFIHSFDDSLHLKSSVMTSLINSDMGFDRDL